MDRLTNADLARMRAEHVEVLGCCMTCLEPDDGDSALWKTWPCDTARLLAELDWRKANPPEWQGRRHRSPVPHLAQFSPGAWTEQPVTGAQHDRWMAEHDAGVAAGLFGPSRSEELPHGT